MLSLSRKWGQRVEIIHGGETLTIVVDRLGRGGVKIGFDGDKSFNVRRPESGERRQETEEQCRK